MLRLFANAHYDFIAARRYAYAVTALFILPGVIAIMGLSYIYAAFGNVGIGLISQSSILLIASPSTSPSTATLNGFRSSLWLGDCLRGSTSCRARLRGSCWLGWCWCWLGWCWLRTKRTIWAYQVSEFTYPGHVRHCVKCSLSAFDDCCVVRGFCG